MYNVGFISDLISTIMIILLIIGLTADKRKEAAENRAERKALLKEENERSWREEFTTKILSQVGKNFFIKYYYSLKNWETPDIIDIIEEEYSENSKITRINNAKKLFEHNLEIFALEKIISSPTVKTDIKNIAQTIFDEEKSAISHSN